MKKISTLAVALITMGSLVTPAQADVVPTSTLPSGYYKIKSATTETDKRFNIHLFSDYFLEGNTNHATLLNKVTKDNNNYIWKITNDGKSSTIGIVNGQGTPIKRENGNKGQYTYAKHFTLTPSTSDSEFPSAILFKEYLFTTKADGSDQNHQYGDYTAVAYYNNFKGNNTKWNLEKVDVDAKAYTVSIVTTSTSTTKPYISRTLTDGTKEYAFNSGFFISDVDLDKTSLSASTLEGYENPDINVDNTAKTVTVYYAKFDDLTALITSATELLNTRGIGYPLSTSAAHIQLASVIDIASDITAASSTKDCAEAYTYLQNAITNYRSTTTGIQMPEDGKVYKMYGLNGANKYYAKNGENQNFVVQKIKDGTYRFVSTSGDQKGYTFESQIDLDLKVYRRINFGALNLASSTASIAINSNGSTGRFSHGNYVGVLNGVGYSTEIYFEEVTDFAGQPVNFVANNDGQNYATLNLPYASKLPEGVTAYKGTVSGNEVTLTEYKHAGEVLPANTPVLLTATEASSYNFAPAAYQAAEETGFQGTLAATAVTANNAYILAKKGEEVKFYLFNSESNTVNANKAYIVVSEGNAQAISFNFGTTTGIQAATADAATAAPVFDLTGRRVVKVVKGGLYIQNGKKFIVK